MFIVAIFVYIGGMMTLFTCADVARLSGALPSRSAFILLRITDRSDLK